MDSPVLILLAGGKSSRMGFPKGLLDFQGTFWILEQISRYKGIENPKIYIGLGYDYKQYFKAISWFNEAITNFYKYDGVEVRVVLNDTPQFGAFSTLQSVLSKINQEASVLVQPIDVPLLNTEDLNSINIADNTIVIPKCDGKNGHPVKLKSRFWKTLLSVEIASKKARLDLLIKKASDSSITYVDVMDNTIYQNINTKEDWNNYLDNC